MLISVQGLDDSIGEKLLPILKMNPDRLAWLMLIILPIFWGSTRAKWLNCSDESHGVLEPLSPCHIFYTLIPLGETSAGAK
jgi:hypothetical protein